MMEALLFTFFPHDYPSMYDQLSHPDRHCGPSSKRKDLHLQEADPLSELDRSADQRYDPIKTQLYKHKSENRRVFSSLRSSVSPEFNVGQYRRDFLKIYKSFEFFRPDNEEGLKIRRYKSRRSLSVFLSQRWKLIAGIFPMCAGSVLQQL